MTLCAKLQALSQYLVLKTSRCTHISWWSLRCNSSANGALCVFASSMATLSPPLRPESLRFVWWSPDALAICADDGMFRVSRVDDLSENILFGPSLEYSFPVSFAPLAMDAEIKRKRGVLALECSNFAWVDKSSFASISPPPSGNAPVSYQGRALLREYEIESVLEATPADVYESKIAAEEYGIALRIAEKYALDKDTVYKAQWRRRTKISKETFKTI